jgi:hypothetical protein
MSPDATVRVGPEAEARTPVDPGTAILALPAILAGTAFLAVPNAIRSGMLSYCCHSSPLFPVPGDKRTSPKCNPYMGIRVRL